ncbi:hypothetical protein DH2020_029761 [Rehmannia glutinosa]|uniref:peptidylprolyl isomerase n=1 Tax=Rehmannia glutinosa TaxID=99300 RepID=A0ABR0VRP6_REHGL
MGVEKELLRAGTGPKPVSGQNVTIHCTGFGKNGDLAKKFWSTKDPGQKPFSFQIGQGKVIKVLSDYAYGPSGFPAWGIQPNSVLVFEIEVLSAE